MSINLSIKGVPDDLAERLRARAERHHRSLQGELMAIIEQAAAELPEPARGTAGSSAPQRALASPSQRGWKTIDDLIAERAQRPSRHTDGLPLAVDIIRADRDGR